MEVPISTDSSGAIAPANGSKGPSGAPGEGGGGGGPGKLPVGLPPSYCCCYYCTCY